MVSGNDALAVVVALVAALATAGFGVLAGAGVLAAPSASRSTVPGPACAEWTDGCVICTRTPQGEACSTPGIACTRGRVQCLRPQGTPI